MSADFCVYGFTELRLTRPLVLALPLLGHALVESQSCLPMSWANVVSSDAYREPDSELTSFAGTFAMYLDSTAM
jgi:hypothetical protein